MKSLRKRKIFQSDWIDSSGENISHHLEARQLAAAIFQGPAYNGVLTGILGGGPVNNIGDTDELIIDLANSGSNDDLFWSQSGEGTALSHITAPNSPLAALGAIQIVTSHTSSNSIFADAGAMIAPVPNQGVGSQLATNNGHTYVMNTSSGGGFALAQVSFNLNFYDISDEITDPAFGDGLIFNANPGLAFASTYLNVNFGPNGLLVVDPITNTILYDDPDFANGRNEADAYAISFPVIIPDGTPLGFNYASGLGATPTGFVNVPPGSSLEVHQTTELSWSFQLVIISES